MKETVAGAVLLGLWLTGMVVWSNFHRVVPDLSNDEPQREGSWGHPLWQE